MNKILICMGMLWGIVLSVCGQDGAFRLKGNVHTKEYDGIYMYLYRCDVVDHTEDGQTMKLDSCRIENGTFGFAYDMKGGQPFVVRLALPPKDDHFMYGLEEAICMAEPGEVTIDYTPDGIQLKGGKLNQEYDDSLLRLGREIHKKTDVIIAERTALEKKGPISQEQMEGFNQRLRALYADRQPALVAFTKKYIRTDIGAYFFFSYAEDYFGKDNYQEMAAQVNPSYLQRKEALVKAQEDRQKEFEASRRAMAARSPYRDFEARTPEGKAVKLSDYMEQGKVTIIDFWASWCVPCVQEIPTLKGYYRDYHDKGLNIVSVSLDTKESAWLNAVKKHQMPWPQISDLKGWKGSITQLYGVAAIPFVVVVDRQGRMAVINMHGDKLKQELVKLLRE